MIEQMDYLDWLAVFSPFFVMFGLIFLMGLMIFLYLKMRVFPLMVIVYGFSLWMFSYSLNVDFPLTPIFQIFFIVFQSVLFIITSIEVYNHSKR